MQVDPIKPMLKPPGTKRLKLEYDGLLSTFTFNFNLRRYIKEHKESKCVIQPPGTHDFLGKATSQMEIFGWYKYCS